MRTHIDWLTFTFNPLYPSGTMMQYVDALERGLVDLFGRELAHGAFGGSWERRERSRAPYTDSWQLGDSGITVFASPNLTHATVEISGSGCEYLIELNLLNEVLTKCRERVTRIDIATDIETGTIPSEFVFFTKHERMRASGFQRSETGETCYIGSQKSDRYARVYRYFAPHPRSNLLRIEHVFRRAYAKQVAAACCNASVESVSRAAGKAFGWSHSDWQPEAAQSVDISITSPERGQKSTVRWLITSCAPAFKRLCEDGTIRDPRQFLADYFFPYEGDKPHMLD